MQREPEVEVSLAGGHMGAVTRRGDVVVRPAGPWTPAVHRLLRHCHARGFGGVPTPVGVRDDGREELTYLPGECPQYPMPAWVWSEAALASAAGLLRDFHAATADADRTGPWRSPVREPAEVVCHHDAAPYNMVFVDGLATGLIDLDFAAPGPRLWDLAYLAYRIVPLSTDRADGFSDAERLTRLDQLLAAYDPAHAWSHDEVLAMVAARLDHLAAFSDEKAVELGNPELHDHARQYRDDIGHVERLRRDGAPQDRPAR